MQITSVTEKLKEQIQNEAKKSAKVKSARSTLSTLSSVKSHAKQISVSPKLSVIPEVPTKTPVKSEMYASKQSIRNDQKSVDRKNTVVSQNASRQSAISRKTENPSRVSNTKDDSLIEQRSYKKEARVNSNNPERRTSAISKQSRRVTGQPSGNISQQSAERASVVTARNSAKDTDLKTKVAGSKASLTLEGESASIISRNKSQTSVRPEISSKRSETFVQNSQKSIVLSSVSRKGSIVTTKSVKGVTTEKNNDSKDTVEHRNGSIKDGISGKTFFSDGKGSQRNLSTGQVSRPGSKRQK